MVNIKKICIIGAGNLGIACAVELAQQEDFNVVLLTSKASYLPTKFIKKDTDTNETLETERVKVTDSYEIALTDTDLCIITLPAFLIKDCIEKVSVFNPKIVLFTPGYGDKHSYCDKLIKKGCIITGFDRSPYICRLSDMNTVFASKKSQIRLGALNSDNVEDVAALFSALFKFKVEALPNYLTVNFTPSNPILHTSRLYSLFKNCEKNSEFSRMIKFYAEWTDDSSEIMLAMDQELQLLCRTIEKLEKIDLSKVIPLTVHYESPTVEAMTKKISGINSFKNINSPMVLKDGKYYIDWESRYFREDFQYGLAILRKYAIKYGVNTPTMDMVWNWYLKKI